MRLLLVEDSEKLRGLLTEGLKKHGFSVDCARGVQEAAAALEAINFAAVILDLGLPDGDGLSVLRFIRGRGLSTPVLILTARGTLQNRLDGLSDGADDYIVKPFAFEELVARLRAILRRPSTFFGDKLRLGRMTFDTETCEIHVGDKIHPMPRREAAVLELLLRRSGRVVPKKIIEDRFYGLSEDGSANAVEVCVHRLRKQLAEANADVEVHTIRGVGYLLKEAAP